jgi:hypothetical protein
LFFVLAAIWLLFGILSLIRMANGVTDQTITMWVVAVLVVANAGAMLVAGLGLRSGHRLSYYFALVLLVANLVLTVTDQFGVFDLITLLIDAALLVLLLVTRKGYLSAGLANRGEPNSEA